MMPSRHWHVGGYPRLKWGCGARHTGRRFTCRTARGHAFVPDERLRAPVLLPSRVEPQGFCAAVPVDSGPHKSGDGRHRDSRRSVSLARRRARRARAGLGARAQRAARARCSRRGPTSPARARASAKCSIRANASPTSRAAGPGSTTSGKTPTIRAACGGARRWPSTEKRSPPGRLCSTSTRWAATEHENWVWAGAACLRPADTRCLLKLSRGGADASVVREYDLVTRALRRRRLHAARGQDRHRLARPRHRASGHRLRRRLAHRIGLPARRQALAPRPAAGAGEHRVRGAGQGRGRRRSPSTSRRASSASWSAARSTSTTRELGLLRGDRVVPIDKPVDAQLDLLARSRAARIAQRLGGRRRHAPGRAARCCWPPCRDYLAGRPRLRARCSSPRRRARWRASRPRARACVLDILDNVASRLQEWLPSGGRWRSREVKAPHPGTHRLWRRCTTRCSSATSWPRRTWLHVQRLPDARLADARPAPAATSARPLKSRPRFFDATGMRVEQRAATSKDGTRVPYFVVWPKRRQGRRPQPDRCSTATAASRSR